MSDNLHEDQPLDDVDFGILAELNELLVAADPPPPGLAERVKFEVSWAALKAEVAQLQASEPVGVRAEQTYASTDTVTFSSSRVNLMIRVSREPASAQRQSMVRVDGWLTGRGRQVDLLVDGQTFTAQADSTGRIVWAKVPAGMAKFLIHVDPADGQPVITPVVQM